MTKAVGYIRVSTQGQARDGYSLAYQRDEIVRHCANNGIELARIYEDKGISGAKVDEDGLTVEREGLQSMLANLLLRSVRLVSMRQLVASHRHPTRLLDRLLTNS